MKKENSDKKCDNNVGDVKIENNVDTSKIGSYTVKYTVSFSYLGTSITKTVIQTVTVE